MKAQAYRAARSESSTIELEPIYSIITPAPPSTPVTEQLADVRFRLLTAGCTIDHVSGAWTCPVCHTAAALRVRDGIDGATVLDCARRCLRGAILSAIGLTFLDVGPSCFRHERTT